MGASLSIDMGLLFECKPCGTMLWHVLRRRRALSDTDQPYMAHLLFYRTTRAQGPTTCSRLCSGLLFAQRAYDSCSGSQTSVLYGALPATLSRAEAVTSLRRRRQSLCLPVNSLSGPIGFTFSGASAQCLLLWCECRGGQSTGVATCSGQAFVCHTACGLFGRAAVLFGARQRLRQRLQRDVRHRGGLLKVRR